MSPDSLTHTSNVPHKSKPVVVKVVLSPELNFTDSKAPELLSIASFGVVQLPVVVLFMGEAVMDPSSAFCETTEF